RHAAIFERQAVGIFEVDRLSPTAIGDAGRLDPSGAQLVAPLGQSRWRTGLEGKMIEAGENADLFRARAVDWFAPAYCHRGLSMDKITRLDARFRYLRAVSLSGVMQRSLRCYRHYTD